MDQPIRVLVIGCGHMGAAHARAYAHNPGFQLAGLVDPDPEPRQALASTLGGPPQFNSFEAALAETRPQAVCIATYPATHAPYALAALRSGCHVFVEKPLGVTVEEGGQVVDLSRQKKLQVVVGYILQVHPGWQRFIELARGLGKPLVMRMNLNQQSSGEGWRGHLRLMESASPLVDCGVHYVDVMRQMVQAAPLRVQAVGACLSGELATGMYNYGNLQVVFADGSVGWYEAGWGPMVSESAYYIKDVFGPLGSVSMVTSQEAGGSGDIEKHTRASCLRLHRSQMDGDGGFAYPDETFMTPDEPDHQALCDLEQERFLKAIRGELDLADHLAAAVEGLQVVLAADESVRTGKVIDLVQA